MISQKQLALPDLYQTATSYRTPNQMERMRGTNVHTLSPDSVPRFLPQSFQPIFWQKAKNSAEVQAPYFQRLLSRDNYITLICEDDDGVNGFIIGAVSTAPASYDPVVNLA